MNWQDKLSVKKGNIGEQIVNDYLVSKNYIPYSPDVDGAHPFDRLVASKDKKRIFIADVKSKAKRRAYPDTGINIAHYQDYKNIGEKYGIEVFVFFVDEEAAEIYGNLLRKLDEPRTVIVRGQEVFYPLEQGIIRYFPLINMITIAEIPSEKSINLRELTNKNPKYL